MEIVQVCLFGTLVAFEHLVERTFAWRDFPVRVLTDDVSLFLFKKGHTKPVINCNRFFLKFIFFFYFLFFVQISHSNFQTINFFSHTAMFTLCLQKQKNFVMVCNKSETYKMSRPTFTMMQVKSSVKYIYFSRTIIGALIKGSPILQGS